MRYDNECFVRVGVLCICVLSFYFVSLRCDMTMIVLYGVCGGVVHMCFVFFLCTSAFIVNKRVHYSHV